MERFICLKKCMSKALLDWSIEHDISTTEFLFLNDLKCALEPIKLVVDALCRKDATLPTAEGIFRFLFFDLKKRKLSLAKDLLCFRKPYTTKATTRYGQWWIFKIRGLRQNSNKGPRKIDVVINNCDQTTLLGRL